MTGTTDDVLREINSIIRKSELTQTELKKVDSVIDNARVVINSAKGQVEDEIRYGPVNAQSYAKQSALEAAPTFFTGEVEDAVAKNDEFAYYAFLDPLFEISHYDDLYSIIVKGTGWGAIGIVTLNMNDVAGDISDYANAVSAARDNLKMGSGDPVKASAIWKDKVYARRGGFSAYGMTISERLSQTSSPAPFWSLLNDGNKVNMSSDRGGTAYPSRSGTHFVEKTEKLIESEFRFQMSNLRAMSDNFVGALMSDIRSMESSLSELIRKINDISLTPNQMDFIAKQIGVEREKLSSTKLYKAKMQLESGEFRSQYYVGAPGYGTRVRRKKLSAVLNNLPIGE